MAYAVEEPKDFHEIYRADVPADVQHWHTNARREVRLERPAERIYIRYVGDPAVNHFHIYAHCTDDGRPSARPVMITHTWRQADGPKSRSVSLKQPGPYEIVTEGDPVCGSVEIAVPSDGP